MMNMIQLQEQLKDFSQQQLIQEMKMPSGNVPQYLVLSEMQRRKRMQTAAAGDQGRPQTTVAEDAVAAAGVPQGGIAQMARTMAPQTDMTQNTGVAAMAGGGLAGISRDVDVYSPTLGAGLTRDEMAAARNLIAMGMDPEDVMDRIAAAPAQLPDQERERLTIEGAAQGEFAGMEDGVPAGGTGEGYYPTWQDVRNVAGGATVGVVAPGLLPAMVASGGPRDLAYDVAEGVGFGPAMEAAGIEDPAIARQQARDERDAQAERQRISEEGALPMTTGEMLTVGENESLLPPTPETPEAPEDTGGGAGGDGGPSAADRLAMQDRWLALARFGLGLMSSDQPTFGGAIGEAGMSALDYMQGMEQQRFERDLAERTLEARSAGSSRPPISLDNYIGALQAQLNGAQERLANLSLDPNATRDSIATAEAAVADAQNALQQAVGAAGMSFGFGPATQALTQTLIDARDSAAG